MQKQVFILPVEAHMNQTCVVCKVEVDNEMPDWCQWWYNPWLPDRGESLLKSENEEIQIAVGNIRARNDPNEQW